MHRLNFLEDEPWDEVEDDKRVRWFGHPFEAAWVATRHPERPVPEDGDEGVIARFVLASDD